MKKRASEQNSNSELAIAELRRDTSEKTLAADAGHRLISGVIVGRLVGLLKAVGPLVDFPDNFSTKALAARSIISLQTCHVGCEVLLSFEGGEPDRPVVVGIMNDHAQQQPKPIELTIDEDSVVFTAQKEITLRCGKASITLTRAGKVLIRGAYLLSRSLGVNRIKGGSVQIN